MDLGLDLGLTTMNTKRRLSSIAIHTVKILGFGQKKFYKGFYAKNVVLYTCIHMKMIFNDFEIICWEILELFTDKVD